MANLCNLEVDLVFFDTSSTYFETERLEEEEQEDEEGEEEVEEEGLVESGIRKWSKHSKDHRPDLLTELVTVFSLVRASRCIGGWVMVLAHGHCQRWGAQGSRDTDRAGGGVVGCDRRPLRALPAG